MVFRIKIAEYLFTPMFCFLWQKEADIGGGQYKRMFLKISQFTRKHMCQSFFFNKVASGAQKRDSGYRCFFLNFATFLRTPFYRTPRYDCFWTEYKYNNVKMIQRNIKRNYNKTTFRSSVLQMFFKINVLENFAISTGKHLCWKKETPIQVFSYEHCEIFKNDFS